MSKRILSLMLCFVMVMSTVMVAPAFAAETNTITITPDKTTAVPGETITYTLTANAITVTSLMVEMNVPAGLTYVSGSAIDKSEIGWDDLSWTDQNKPSVMLSGYGDIYEETGSKVLATFTCTVDANASGDLEIEVTAYDVFDENDEEVENAVVNDSRINVSEVVATTATKVVYAGVEMDATNKYLYANVGQTGGSIAPVVSSSDVAPNGKSLFAEFDASTGTLTLKRTYNIEDWNSMTDPKVLPGATDKKLYGIWANGDLILDIGDSVNFINLDWKKPEGEESYNGIYVKGDFTLKGNSGRLKIAAHPSRSASNPTSYGINAEGNVNLEGGILEIFAKPNSTMVGGTAVNIHAQTGNIYLNGATVRFRAESNKAGYITPFGKGPIIAPDYDIEENLDLEMTGSTLGIVEAKDENYNNPGMSNYSPKATITFVTNGGSAVDPVTVTAGTLVDLSEYVPTMDGFNLAGWFTDAEFTKKVSSITPYANVTLYAKWKKAGTGGVATEVYYAGAKLDATNKYLFYKVEGGVVNTKSDSSEVTTGGYMLYGEFDAARGKLTMLGGFDINGWNSYAEAKLLDGVYYGIYANGSLILDIGSHRNTLNLNWNYPDNGQVMENICVEGDLTIRGTSGVLRICANPTLDSDGEFMSYGIKADGNVYLNGGTIEFYTKPVHLKTARPGAKVTQLASINGNIYFDGATVQFLADPSRTYITKMNKAPILGAGYTQPDASNLYIDGSIGWWKTDGSGNTNAAKYVAPPKKQLFVAGNVLDKDTPYLVPDGIGWKALDFDNGKTVARFDATNDVLEFTANTTIQGVSCAVDGTLNAYNCVGGSFPYEIKVNKGVTVNLLATSRDGISRAIWSTKDVKISGGGTINVAAGPSTVYGEYRSGGIWADGKVIIDGVDATIRTVYAQNDGKSGHVIYGGEAIEIVNGAKVIAGTDKGKLVNVAPTIYSSAKVTMASESTGDMDTPYALTELRQYDASTVTAMKFLNVVPVTMDLVNYAGYGTNGAILVSDPVVEFTFTNNITNDINVEDIIVSGTATVGAVEKDGNVLKITFANITKGSTYNVTFNNIESAIGSYSGTVSVSVAQLDMTSVKLNGETGTAKAGANKVEVTFEAGTSQNVFVIAVVRENKDAKSILAVKSVEATVSGTQTVTITGLAGSGSSNMVEVMIWDGSSSRKILGKSVVFGN